MSYQISNIVHVYSAGGLFPMKPLYVHINPLGYTLGTAGTFRTNWCVDLSFYTGRLYAVR
jgi:hypothetical protein